MVPNLTPNTLVGIPRRPPEILCQCLDRSEPNSIHGAVGIRGCICSAMIFRWLVHITWHSHEGQHLNFSQENIALSWDDKCYSLNLLPFNVVADQYMHGQCLRVVNYV